MTSESEVTAKEEAFAEWQMGEQIAMEDQQLYMMSVEGERTDEGEVSSDFKIGEKLVVENSVLVQLSLHALTRVCSFQTMRIRGSKGTRTLFVLINLGSTLEQQTGKTIRLCSGDNFFIKNYHN